MNEDKISDLNKTARESIDRVMNRLGTKPIVDVNDVAEWTGYTTRGAYKVVERMVELGILTENGDKSYGQTWISAEHLVEQQASRGVTSPDTINIVSVSYDANGSSTKTNDLGMREMQKRAFDKRNSQHLLIKAPPASGKSRALMYIALDKLANQGRKKVIIAVPERAIGASFADEDLTSGGFFTDWHIDDRNNLTNEDGDTDKSKVGAFMRFMDGDDQILLCTHATLRYAFEQVPVEKFNDTVLAIDEFHHASTSETSRLGELLHHVMRGSNVQIVAMTGSYFRGDTVPILTAEDEEKFDKVTYTYYEQLSGYSYLKTLGIGYHFYTGKYYDEGSLDAVLDNKRKTIVHIPNVNSRESTKVGKHEEVQRVYDVLGTWLRKDEATGLDIIETSDGRQLKVANLVEDESNHRSKLSKYLFSHARKEIDAVDIIVALGMAKEGFDWPYCEHALTIGYRSSLTEIVQIIGRCTRDSYNKSHAQFTNLIAQPSGTTDDVVVSVNNMLKAITVSLLMEQVLAPSFTFTPRPRDPRKAQPGEVFIKGLKQPTTEKVRRILETDLEDLTATLLQNDQVQKLAAKGVTGDVMKQIQSKIIREQHPDLNDEEIEATRQYLAANVAFKTATIIKGEDGSDKFIKLANRFVKIDELDMNLIDSVNPFHHAFEVISKKVGVDAFKIIQDTILGSRINMTEEEALAFVPQLRAFNVAHMGKMPSANSNDPNEKHLAQVYAFIMAQRTKWEREKAARKAAGQDNG